jgi:RNA polymerase sigma-70 factor (ECF subfamily)
MECALTKTQVQPDLSDGAFEQLVRKTQKQAFGLAYRLTGDMTEAEDLVQETYLRAYRFFHRYDRELPFASWIYRIMTNTYVDSLRRKGRIRTTSLDHGGAGRVAGWDVADSRPSPDSVILEGSMDEPVQNALSSINPVFRTAVILADVEEMAYEEIAEIMGTSVGTVRSRIHRGRRQLREHLTRSCPGLFRGVRDEM